MLTSIFQHQLLLRRAAVFRSRVYTFAAGEPMINAQMESRATRMFWKLPMMWIFVSDRTILVREAFSIVNFVLPSLPASRPIALDKCSPFKVCMQTCWYRPSDDLDAGYRGRSDSWACMSQPAYVVYRCAKLFMHCVESYLYMQPQPGQVSHLLGLQTLVLRMHVPLLLG